MTRLIFWLTERRHYVEFGTKQLVYQRANVARREFMRRRTFSWSVDWVSATSKFQVRELCGTVRQRCKWHRYTRVGRGRGRGALCTKTELTASAGGRGDESASASQADAAQHVQGQLGRPGLAMACQCLIKHERFLGIQLSIRAQSGQGCMGVHRTIDDAG